MRNLSRVRLFLNTSIPTQFLPGLLQTTSLEHQVFSPALIHNASDAERQVLLQMTRRIYAHIFMCITNTVQTARYNT